MSEGIYVLLGVLLGGVLTTLNFWIEGRKANIRIRKTVLFNLLEIRNILRRYDLSDLTRIATALVSVFPEIRKDPAAVDNLKKLITPLITEAIDMSSSQDLKEIASRYHETISLLASIDPTRAINLSAKTKIFTVFDRASHYFSGLKKQHPNDEAILDKINKDLIGGLKPEYMLNELLALEEDIISIAKSVGISTYWKITKLLKAETASSSELESSYIKLYRQMLKDNGILAN